MQRANHSRNADLSYSRDNDIMTTYMLGITSVDAIQLYPEYNFKEGKKQIRSDHRSKSGRLRLYKWGEFHKLKFKVNYIPASEAAVINSWWDSNTELLWFVTSDTATDVTSVMILNKETPINQYNEPYSDMRKGVLQLESY